MFKRLKNLKSEEFDRLVQPIIVFYSLIFGLIIFGILSIFSFRFSLSFLLCFTLSLLIFIKNNYLITNFLLARIFNPRFWMIVNNIINMALYMGAALLLYKVPYLSLVGISGLFVVAITTVIISSIYDK